nr:MAG TPA: hypothetical protein [Caudoviricetes sp.]
MRGTLITTFITIWYYKNILKSIYCMELMFTHNILL